MTQPAGRIAGHVRANVVAYLALFCSLAGTSYAALSIPDGSVGARQLHNHAITPVKFDPSAIGGSIRDWAVVAASGKILASSSRVVERDSGEGQVDTYLLGFGRRFSGKCLGLATARPSSTAIASPPPAAGALANVALVPPNGAIVKTFDGQGQPALEAFYIAIIC